MTQWTLNADRSLLPYQTGVGAPTASCRLPSGINGTVADDLWLSRLSCKVAIRAMLPSLCSDKDMTPDELQFADFTLMVSAFVVSPTGGQ